MAIKPLVAGANPARAFEFMTWTPEQIGEEWRYRFLERIGILCGTGDPTDEQLEIALNEADAAISELTKGS